MIKKFLDWYDAYTDRRMLNEMARFWYSQGSHTPYADAENERYFRLKLEEFRNFASMRYLDEPSITQAELKNEWITARIVPMLKSSIMQADGKMLMDAINVMGDEMFVGKARRARRLEINGAVSEAKDMTDSIKKMQRDRALLMI